MTAAFYENTSKEFLAMARGALQSPVALASNGITAGSWTQDMQAEAGLSASTPKGPQGPGGMA